MDISVGIEITLTEITLTGREAVVALVLLVLLRTRRRLVERRRPTQLDRLHPDEVFPGRLVLEHLRQRLFRLFPRRVELDDVEEPAVGKAEDDHGPRLPRGRGNI
jgi:hypothetical protein